ncbi:MAG TPA: DUF4173 domain-containing protein [Anaerolineales bacterium]|nr:DUF4173 domain-containing protein [Anaerolineales bacterium]
MSEQENEVKQEGFLLNNKSLYVWIVLAVGWLFDFLFWDKVPGISIALFIFIVLGVGFYLARQQGLSPAPGVQLLVIPILFFAVMTFIRVEPMTVFLNMSAALALMGLLAHSFLGGKWWRYTFKDHFLAFFFVGVDAMFRQISVFTSQPKAEVPETGDGKPEKSRTRTTLAVVRGLLIALPIVLVFGAMLAEADPIFEQVVGDFLDFFQIENLGEYIFRAILICIIAYVLLGVYLHAFYKNHDDGLVSDESKRLLPRFLGFTESAIILGSVNLLFLAFVVIQFQYFFGGQENINLTGFTYAEYARRGFSELVAVSVFSLLLFMGLSFITKKADRAQGVFSGLGVALLALVTVILVSSFQRLHLYEQAYGFSRLRTYTHVFIFWLGALLAGVIVLELIRRPRFFALATVIACMGFVVTLDVMNVDGFIVRQNVGRTAAGEELDIGYLASLSEDALPIMANLYTQADRPADQDALRGAIACHAVNNYDYDYADHPYNHYSWQSFHLSRFRAQQTWDDLGGADDDVFGVIYGDEYEEEDPWNAYVTVDGEEISCQNYRYGWD